MMKQNFLHKVLPHIIAVAIFLIVAVIFCKPTLEGKVLQQEDVSQWKAMAQNQLTEKEKTGSISLWSNGMFSGMPGFLIIGNNNNYVGYYFSEVLSLFLPKPIKFFFLACVCFYFLAITLRGKPWVGVITALGYAYATYNPVIVVAGHDTKMLSIAMLPGFIAALIWIYEKKYIVGATLLAFFTAAFVTQNHYQIVYYGVITAFIMTMAYAIQWIKAKDFKHLLLAGGITLLSAGIGILSNAVVLFTNYDYSKATIRGGSALADDNSNIGKDGLSKSYALDYSLAKAEPASLLVPNIYGGSVASIDAYKPDGKTIETLQSMPQELAQQLGGYARAYWGEGNNSGPAYAGAIIVFLALIGFASTTSKHRIWILVTAALTIMMSWGSNFESFSTFLLNHLPMYNKFRAPGMILVVPTLLLGMMAVIGLNAITEWTDSTTAYQKFKKGLYTTLGVFAFLGILYFMLDYKGAAEIDLLKQVQSIQDAQQKASLEPYINSFVNSLAEDRKAIFLSSLFRSFFFILIAAAAIGLYIKKQIRTSLLLIILGIFSLIDLLNVDSKYLNSEKFFAKEDEEQDFAPRAVDQQILQDTSHYRVLDLSQGIGAALTYGAKPTSLFHENIGGYHPAKLSIYQDLIEKQLSNFPNCMPVLNMLNTKYIIFGNDNQLQVQVNPQALGNAWFVKGIQWTNSPKEVMNALTNLNTKDSVVMEASIQQHLPQTFSFDSAATITLRQRQNDYISYTSTASQNQLAVFSEIFYDKGWNAYIDGKPAPIYKANYVLRSIMVPAGNHQIEFKFEPKSYYTGRTITNICSILMLFMLVLTGYMVWKQKKLNEAS